jgi:hypothetical protein
LFLSLAVEQSELNVFITKIDNIKRKKGCC